MENKLITTNKNELELTKEGIQFIRKLQKAKVEVAKMEEQLKELFLNAMEENEAKNYTSPDGTFKATYVAETTTNRFDSKRFKEEHKDLYSEYQVSSVRKAYVKFD